MRGGVTSWDEKLCACLRSHIALLISICPLANTTLMTIDEPSEFFFLISLPPSLPTTICVRTQCIRVCTKSRPRSAPGQFFFFFFFSFRPPHLCPQPTHTRTQSRQPPAPSKFRLLSFFFLYPHPPVSTTIPHPRPQPTPCNASARNCVHHPHL